MISQSELKQLLNYNFEIGVFTWIKRNQNIAGSIHCDGYIHIRIGSKRYFAHRLAWLYIYGKWPNNLIDHINGIRNNNKISNLRDVTNRENLSNTYKHRDGKLWGCSFNKQKNKWQSYVYIDKKLKHLGWFNTELESHNNSVNYIDLYTKKPDNVYRR